jgi:hypothetical protein
MSLASSTAGPRQQKVNSLLRQCWATRSPSSEIVNRQCHGVRCKDFEGRRCCVSTSLRSHPCGAGRHRNDRAALLEWRLAVYKEDHIVRVDLSGAARRRGTGMAVQMPEQHVLRLCAASRDTAVPVAGLNRVGAGDEQRCQ